MKILTSFLFMLFVAAPVFAQDAEALFDKAIGARDANEYKTALKFVDEALKIDPKSADYLIFRTDILFELQRYEEAVITINTAIEHNPRVSSVYGKRADLLSTVGFYDVSLADYALAIQYADNDTVKYMYHTNRSATHMLYRHFEEAYDDLLLAYSFDSTDVVMLSNMAMVCDAMGEYDKALNYIFRVEQLRPDFDALYSNIGFIYQNKGDHQKAIVYFDKSIQNDEKDAFGYNNRAYSKLQLDDLKGAMADVETSLKLMPSNAYAYRNRALIWIAMGKTKKACEDLQTAIDKGFLEQYGPEAAELQSKHCR